MSKLTPIRRYARKTIYSNPWTTFHVDTVALPNDQKGHYAVVEKKDAVLIIPTQDSQFLLVRQYRYPVNEWTWEFPQGSCEAQESVLDTAQRELKEETGYEPRSMRILTHIYEIPGLATHKISIVHAEIGQRGDSNTENTEIGLYIQWFNYDTLQSMLCKGELREAMSIAALLCYSSCR